MTNKTAREIEISELADTVYNMLKSNGLDPIEMQEVLQDVINQYQKKLNKDKAKRDLQ